MITSTTNDRVKWVRSLQARRRTRETERAFVAEGTRWAQELLKAQFAPQYIFHTEPIDSEDETILQSLTVMGAELIPVSEQVMAAMSDTESPQGLLMVAPFPQLDLPTEPSFLVAVDQLADPGNLGTLLRTSLAAGVEGLVLTPGTVDPFNPKVVRGAMGAQLHLPLKWAEPSELKTALAGLPLWLAETNQGPAYTQVDWQPPCALLIGSEAHGARAKLAELADQVTHIPMEGPSDSLNAAVAAAVILFEIRRQRGNA